MSPTTTPTSTQEEMLGGEAHLLDANVEIKGVEAMMQDLTDEEKASLADASMPMRHFRAEKVRKLYCGIVLDVILVLQHGIVLPSTNT